MNAVHIRPGLLEKSLVVMFEQTGSVSICSMADTRLLNIVRPWIEQHLGFPYSAMRADTVPVLAASADTLDLPLRAIKVGNKAALATWPKWVEGLEPVVDDLPLDMLFSVLGAYNLARVTLPYGVGVWGPVWYFFADEESWQPCDNDRVVHFRPSDLANVGYDLFWHCSPNSLAGSGIFDDDRLIALATVWNSGDPMWEIGMDVIPDAKLAGLGRTVVSAAARWILDNSKVVLGTTSPFNVPSARTLRSAGLQHVFTSMNGTQGIMQTGPQPLGLPHPSAKVYNLYPKWAMNKDILPQKKS